MEPVIGPLVSVVLPFYNAEQTLNRAIESISKQSFSDFECFLVNNNSTDKSAEIAEEWCIRDKRFKHIQENNQGVVHAFNKGAELAKGAYIARMDADDVCLPNRFELQVHLLNSKKHIQVASGMVEYVPHRENTEGFSHYVNWVNGIKSSHEIELSQFIESPIVNPTAMWRKELNEQYGLYRFGDFPEDYEMYLRWLQNGVKIEKLSNYILRWYDSDTRLTRTNKIYSNDSFYRIKSQYLYNWLMNRNPFHPHVVVWGASKLSRNNASYIESLGVNIEFYIDVTKKRQIDKQLVFYEDLPTAGKYFILVYLKHNQLRHKIKKFLFEKGYVEGESFLFIS